MPVLLKVAVLGMVAGAALYALVGLVVALASLVSQKGGEYV